MTWGEWMINERHRLGIDREKMCQILYDVPMQTLKSWELGYREPPAWAKQLISDRLEVFIHV